MARSSQGTHQHSNHNLSVSVGRSTLFGVLSNVVQVSTRLVTVPIVIGHLGLGGYGIWSIIMMTATYMRFGSVGVKTAFQKYVAEATGDGNYDRANKLLSTGCAVMLVLSVVGSLSAALLSYHIAKWAGVPTEFLTSASHSIAVLALIMGMSNVGAAFEATVMGGHRVDIVRKVSTILGMLEAGGVVTAMYMGYGLLAMSCVMGCSELAYVSICYVFARQVVPQIRVSRVSVTAESLPELFRFAGSYQLVNILEILYASLLPFAILRTFGANVAGVYAVVVRVVGCATIVLDAFLPPMLSAATMVYASGSQERLRALLTTAFKVTLAVSLVPLGFIAVFGSTLAWAWTGVTDPAFKLAFWLVAAKGVLSSVSLLALILYRVSGRAVLDNIRQVIRIALIMATVVVAKKVGFYGVLVGMGLAEFAGMLFMMVALTRTYHVFRVRALLPDAARVTAAAAMILGAGILASHLPVPAVGTGRVLAFIKLAEIVGVCLLVAWPVVRRTGAITVTEGQAILGNLLPRTNRGFAPAPSAGN